MPFNQNRFLSTSYRPRTAEVKVPELRDIFDDLKDGEIPVFRVKSLSRTDFIRMQDVSERNSNWVALIEAAGANNAKELVEKLKSTLGLNEDMPEGASREIIMLQAGMDDPELSTDAAVKLYETFPMVVTRLINEISRLTNAGWEPGKRDVSTKTKMSATA